MNDKAKAKDPQSDASHDEAVRRSRLDSAFVGRLRECDIVIGYNIADDDTFVIKDGNGVTGRVSHEHALKRLALAKLRSEVEYEMSQEEGLDELDEDAPSRGRPCE